MMEINRLRLGSGSWELGSRTGILGILNVTPDSFSDGGRFEGEEAAIQQAREMAKDGANILDVGGESTKPGFTEISVDMEIARVVPVIERIASDSSMPIVSIDTTKAAVARAALEAGASVVNDIWGFQRDPEMASIVAKYDASCVLMHNARGGWLREGVLDSIKAYWERSVSLALEAGVTEDRIILDPGIGFTDTRDQDLKILRGLRELRCFGFPILLGSSRKRITGEPFGFGLEDRLETTLATTALGIEAGVDFVRVHDVKGNVRAAKMADLIVRA